MSPVIITPPPVPPPVDPGSDAPATLTVTYYRQLAAHLLQAIDEIAVIIPRLQEDTVRTIVAPKPASGHRNIPLVFLNTTVDAVAKHPELQVINKLDVNRGRDTLQLIEAFRSIQDRSVALVRDLDQVIDQRRSGLTLEALDVYVAARVLARDNSNSGLSESVANMKRDLGRNGGPRKKPPTPPSPTTPPETPEGKEKDTEPRGHAARV